MGGIRFILALSVALWHIPQHPVTLVYSWAAVLGFFIISGFYMAMVLTEKYRDARSFYIARFWRLYPAYGAMLIIMIVWFTITHSPNAFTSRLPLPGWEQATIVALNVGVVGQDVFEFARAAFGDTQFRDTHWMLVGQAWSLSSEVFFYLLAPFVVRSATRTMALLAAGLAIRFVLLDALGLPTVWGYFFPGSACMFLLGAMAYHIGPKLPGRMLILAWAAALAYSVATAGIMLAPGRAGSIDGPGFWLAYVAFALSVPAIFAWSKDSRLDRHIGELSYPLYLVHGFVQGIIFFKLGAAQGQTTIALMAVSASIAAAIMMRILVEIPVEMLRSKSVTLKGALPQISRWASRPTHGTAVSTG
jgi:peptidoglycan/LPS O-acetylase OafA/YrhL